MSIYILCGAVLVAGFALAFWLKREAERSWERHQEMVRLARAREAFRNVNKAIVDFQVKLVDNMTPALQRLSAEVARMAESMRPALVKAGEAMRKASEEARS